MLYQCGSLFQALSSAFFFAFRAEGKRKTPWAMSAVPAHLVTGFRANYRQGWCIVNEKCRAKDMEIRIKRVYEQPVPADGRRILVDRLWPRGLAKKEAGIDLWLKEIAPSAELRKWFGHKPENWEEFRKRYFAELKENDEPVRRLKQELDKGMVTLLYAARDEEHNHAVVIREFSALFR